MANADVTRIASNIGALNSLWALQSINKQLGLARTRLSTGKRINSAADDPAGLTIATKLNSRSQGLKTALGNIGDAKNLLAVAEAGVGRITDIIVQMKNRASQGASDTMGVHEREAIQTQLDAYAQQVDDIVAQTNWNSNKLIDGSYAYNSLSFQTGADSGDSTDVSGIINLAATTGTNNLELADHPTASGASATLVAPTTLLVNNPTVITTGINADTDALSNGLYTVQLTHGADIAAVATEVSDPDNRVWTSLAVPVITTELDTGDYTVQSKDSDPSATVADWQYRLVDSVGTVVGPDWTTYAWGTNPFNTGRGLRYGMIDPTPYPKNTSAISETVIHYTHSSNGPDSLKLLNSSGTSVRLHHILTGRAPGQALALWLTVPSVQLSISVTA